MKKFLVLAAMALILAAPGAAWCQQAGNPSVNVSLPDLKAKIVDHLNARIADLQQREACIQAAPDRQTLAACIPPKAEKAPQ